MKKLCYSNQRVVRKVEVRKEPLLMKAVDQRNCLISTREQRKDKREKGERREERGERREESDVIFKLMTS